MEREITFEPVDFSNAPEIFRMRFRRSVILLCRTVEYLLLHQRGEEYPDSRHALHFPKQEWIFPAMWKNEVVFH